MSESKEKVPKIRFPGFTDAWEQRALGKMGDTFTGLSGKAKEDFGHGDAKFVTYVNVFSNAISNPNGVESVEIDDKQKQVKYGDVFFTTSSETPEEVGMSSVWLENTKNVYLNSFCFGYRPTVEFDPYYLAFMLRSSLIREKFMFLAQGVSRYNISKNKVMEMKVPVPKLNEQRKVGAFFACLDHLITLHQRKLNNLKNLKAGLFQKMFPKNGEDFPEVRFPGFTDAWEQRKLGEIYTERKERGYDSLQILSVSIHHGVSNEELDSDNLGKKVRRSEDKSLYKQVHFGDLVLNMMRAWQGAIGVVKSEGMVSPAYITAIPSAELYPLFMDYCLRRDEAIIQMDNLSYGVTDFRKRLYWDSFINVLCRIPSVPEQERITAFFTNLDHLITLHQRKLKHLQEQKKALQQQMFV
ncbi:restriction endonuclease subunit S [Desulfosporosinus shakirovi]|uniref:restriction endonuclease subunit S n=1 Tax=Desulfosporosinus shakirovi TaxID=2885154 RepID=UPI001E63F412|nr:restriction endonuclease subunit S [Desulfosporosinus sp. SRJS8]MCB8817559.1 restriction endonuclease subunit S [Desulfosporosinus sp. SRJS8]